MFSISWVCESRGTGPLGAPWSYVETTGPALDACTRIYTKRGVIKSLKRGYRGNVLGIYLLVEVVQKRMEERVST